MAVSGSMATLDLTYNRIGDVGAKAIAEAVRASGSMANLYLENNNIGAASKQSLQDAVEGRQSFDLYV